LGRRSAKARLKRKISARHQRARLSQDPSQDVADVANRPKKRPGSRLRSSITIRSTRPQANLV
jgi:hypothetical protein